MATRPQTRDALEEPRYFVGEAARYLRLPTSTVRAWSLGRRYGATRCPALIRPADPTYPLLSFSNLVELHVLASLRRHPYSLQARPIRKALDYLAKELGVDRPLLSQEMLTDGKSLFADKVTHYENLSQQGQLQLKQALEIRLRRIERDPRGLTIRLFPFTYSEEEDAPRLIAITPLIRAGRPCISGTRLPTEIIAGRFRRGDGIDLLAEDYGRSKQEIEEALRYEGRAAA